MMSSIVERVKEISKNGKPWIVLGKGPSSDRHRSVKWSDYNVVTLNHACKLVVPAIANFVDLEPYRECGHILAKQPNTIVCLPWHPHLQMRPSEMTLMDVIESERAAGLRHVDEQRFASYNATIHFKLSQHAYLPTVRLRSFSAVVVFNYLAGAGIKTIFSLGVDGGTRYGSNFDTKDLLKNGRHSFGVQDAEIARTLRMHEIKWSRL